MRNLYGKGFDKETREEFRHIIVGVLIEGLKDILRAMKELLDVQLTTEMVTIRSRLSTFPPNAVAINEQIANDIKYLLSNGDFLNFISSKTAMIQLQDCWITYATEAKEYPAWGGDGWVITVCRKIKNNNSYNA